MAGLERPPPHRRAPAPRLAAAPGNRPVVPFTHKLVLNQWLLSLFNVTRFEDLAEHLNSFEDVKCAAATV